MITEQTVLAYWDELEKIANLFETDRQKKERLAREAKRRAEVLGMDAPEARYEAGSRQAHRSHVAPEAVEDVGKKGKDVAKTVQKGGKEVAEEAAEKAPGLIGKGIGLVKKYPGRAAAGAVGAMGAAGLGAAGLGAAGLGLAGAGLLAGKALQKRKQEQQRQGAASPQYYR